MNLTQISSKHFQEIAALLKQKESLLGKVEQIDARLAAFEADGKPGGARSRPRAWRARRGGRPGSIKGKIIGALQKSGKAGATIKEISARTKIRDQNLRSWFYATAKGVRQIKKVGPAKYAWAG
jgi:hypothetical protein